MEELSKNKRKLIRNLMIKKRRLKNGMFTVEGIKFVEEAMHSDFKINFICIEQKKVEKFKTQIELAKEKSIPVFSISQEEKQLFTTDTPQGIIAVVNIPKNIYFTDSSLDEIKNSKLICFLYEVNDPGNLGTIFRTAYWFGVDALILYRCVDPFSPKVVRASAGSIFYQRSFILQQNILKAINNLRAVFKIYSSVPENGINIRELVFSEKSLIFFGNESRGLSDKITNRSDYCFTIPFKNKFESLNVATAFAITVYQFTNQVELKKR